MRTLIMLVIGCVTLYGSIGSANPKSCSDLFAGSQAPTRSDAFVSNLKNLVRWLGETRPFVTQSMNAGALKIKRHSLPERMTAEQFVKSFVRKSMYGKEVLLETWNGKDAKRMMSEFFSVPAKTNSVLIGSPHGVAEVEVLEHGDIDLFRRELAQYFKTSDTVMFVRALKPS